MKIRRDTWSRHAAVEARPTLALYQARLDQRTVLTTQWKKAPERFTRGQGDQPLFFEGLTVGDGLGAGVCFTASDERLIGGQADLWH